MKVLVATTILATMIAGPAVAQTSYDDLTCADFLAMEESTRSEALSAIRDQAAAGAAEGESGSESGDGMAGQAGSEEGDVVPGEMVAGDDAAAIESTEGQQNGDMDVSQVLEVCESDPDILVYDALDQEAQSQ